MSTAQKGRAKTAPGSKPTRKRNPAKTREAILKAAVTEFCRHGFNGARVEEISRRSNANMRLLYHYFGNKAGLYVAVLERVYSEIRTKEQELNLEDLDPVEGMRQLIAFTFTFFATHRDYIALLNNENMLRGKFLARSRHVKSLTIPLLTAIRNLLERGAAAGLFRAGVDPVQLYVSITALSYFHASNRYTLSAMFDQNLADATWLRQRHAHAQDMILAWLMTADGKAPAHARAGQRRYATAG